MIDVDPAVWSNWDDSHRDRGIFVVLHVEQPVDDVMPIVVGVAGSVMEALADFPGVAAEVAEIVPTPTGVVLYIEDGTDLHQLLDPLVEQLAAAGIDGVLARYRQELPTYREVHTDHRYGHGPYVPPGREPIPDGLLECWLALTPSQAHADPAVGWTLSDATIRDVVQFAVNWTSVNGPALYANVGHVWWLTDDDSTSHLVTLGLKYNPSSYATISVISGRRFRHVVFIPWCGQVAFASGPLGPTPETWQTDLDAVTEVLQRLAPHTSYGLIRRTNGPSGIASPWCVAMRAPDDNTVRHVRLPGQTTVEQSTPLDARVIQFVTSPFTDTIPRDRWDVTTTDAGTIITAHDYQPWISTPTPDPTVREAARRDLAAIIDTHLVFPKTTAP